MKNFILLVLLISSFALADQKVSQLPSGSGATSGSTDIFPYVELGTGVTKKMKLYDIANIPSLVSFFAPKANPVFTGTVTGSFSGPLAGNATTATAFDHTPTGCSTGQYSIQINAGGNLTCASVAFSQLTGSLAASQLPAFSGDVASTAGTSVLSIQSGAVTNTHLAGSITDSKLSTISTSGKVANSATTAASANTPSAIVARDSSGNFSAGTVTANVTGNVSGTAASFTGSLAGDVTGTQGATAISSATVTGKILTGLNTTAGTPTATDSILSAIGKNVGQVNSNTSNIALKAPIASPVFTGGITVPMITATETTTPSTPASGYRKLYPKVDGFYQLDSTGAETKVGSGSGGGGGINYLSANPDAETGVVSTVGSTGTPGWAGYANTPGVAPVTGTGGTPTTTWTRETTASGWAPIRGTGSFVFSKPSSNRQGDGVAYNFTIDPADKGKRLNLTFDYGTASGSYNGGEIKIFVYDVSNGTFCDVAKGQTLPRTDAVSSQWTVAFDSRFNSASYRLILHVATPAAYAYSVYFDNFIAGPNSVTTGPPVSDWTSYSPSISTWGTGAFLYNAVWRRVGDSMEISTQIGSGTSPSATTTLPLPSGYTIDSQKLSTTRYTIVGSMQQDSQGVTTFPIAQGGGTAIYFSYFSATANLGSQPQGVVPASVYNSVIVRVPIAGWSSNMVFSSDSNAIPVNERAGSSPSGSLGSAFNVVTFGTVYNDASGTMTTSSWTSPATDSYSITAGLSIVGTWTAGATPAVGITVDGTLVFDGVQIVQNSSSGTYYPTIAISSLKVNKGSVVRVVSYAPGTSLSFNPSSTENYLTISKAGAGSPTYGYQYTAPQVFTYTSGSGSFTTPAGASYLKVRMVGGGGGGGATGSPTTGGTGGTTTFGTSLLTATGGGGSNHGVAGAVGTYTIAAPAYGSGVNGSRGSQSSNAGTVNGGGDGGNSFFGGRGEGGESNVAGSSAQSNSGSGGGGAGATGGGAESGAGGSAGAYIEGYIPVSSGQTFSYAVGAGGSAGTGSSFNGGAGAAGYIEVTVFFANAGDSSVPQNLVTSAATNGATFKIALVAYGSACTTSTCTINYNPGNWLTSVTRSGAGIYSASFPAFSSTTPICSVTSNYGTSVSGITQTSFSWNGVLWGSGAGQDSANIVIMCIDQK